jgi:hypothetical protein
MMPPSARCARRSIDIEALVSFLFIGLLVAFAALSVAFGADSRPGIGDDYARPIRV